MAEPSSEAPSISLAYTTPLLGPMLQVFLKVGASVRPYRFLRICHQDLFEALRVPPTEKPRGPVFTAWKAAVKALWRQAAKGEVSEKALNTAIKNIVKRGGLDLCKPHARLLQDVIAVVENGLLRILSSAIFGDDSAYDRLKCGWSFRAPTADEVKQPGWEADIMDYFQQPQQDDELLSFEEFEKYMVS